MLGLPGLPLFKISGMLKAAELQDLAATADNLVSQLSCSLLVAVLKQHFCHCMTTAMLILPHTAHDATAVC